MILDIVRLTIKIKHVAQVRDYCKHIVNCFQEKILKPEETKQFSLMNVAWLGSEFRFIPTP